jgi:hypothetical protein
MCKSPAYADDIFFLRSFIMRKRMLAGLLMLAVLAGTAAAQTIEPGDIMVSVGGAIGLFIPSEDMGTDDPIIGFGGFGRFDYALPVPLTVGAEVAFMTGKMEGSEISLTLIPLLAQASWHPDFGVEGLDPYVAVKAGYSIMTREAGSIGIDGGGFSFGANLGARYFFTPTVGIFGELDGLYTLGSFEVMGYKIDANVLNADFRIGVTFRF